MCESVQMNKEHVISLFNRGFFGKREADWYLQQGCCLVCHDGLVTDIVDDEE